MPKDICADVVFGRKSGNPIMYRLTSDKAYKWKHDSDLILEISDDLEHPSCRLGGDKWTDCQAVGDINRGRLYHAKMSYYPLPDYEVPEPVQVAVKWVRGKRAIASLRREAEIYDGPLAGLQGGVVPIFGGFFTATTRDGFDVGCLVLEWCPQNDHATFGKPTEEDLCQREEAVRELHAAGVHHGELYERSEGLCVSDGRHFLRALDGTIRIVDFQHAHLHRCVDNDTDLNSELEHGDACEDLDDICDELVFAAGHYQRALDGELIETPWNAF